MSENVVISQNAFRSYSNFPHNNIQLFTHNNTQRGSVPTISSQYHWIASAVFSGVSIAKKDIKGCPWYVLVRSETTVSRSAFWTRRMYGWSFKVRFSMKASSILRSSSLIRRRYSFLKSPINFNQLLASSIIAYRPSFVTCAFSEKKSK